MWIKIAGRTLKESPNIEWGFLAKMTTWNFYSGVLRTLFFGNIMLLLWKNLNLPLICRNYVNDLITGNFTTVINELISKEAFLEPLECSEVRHFIKNYVPIAALWLQKIVTLGLPRLTTRSKHIKSSPGKATKALLKICHELGTFLIIINYFHSNTNVSFLFRLFLSSSSIKI